MVHEIKEGHEHDCEDCERGRILVSQLGELALTAINSLNISEQEKTHALMNLIKNFVLNAIFEISNDEYAPLSHTVNFNHFISELSSSFARIVDEKFSYKYENSKIGKH